MILCTWFCVFFTCAPAKDPLPVAERVITSAHQEFSEMTMNFYEDGIKRWRLDTDYMSRPLGDTGTILVVPIRITVYDSLGNQSSLVKSDSGTSDSNMERFDLWGDVHIKNEEGMTVTGERIKWFKAARKVTSETYVQIETSKGDILRGQGLDAVDDFSRFSFKSDVAGKFPDFRRRMEDPDEDFFR
jgi:LPS export ABC transporter protein LptC